MYKTVVLCSMLTMLVFTSSSAIAEGIFPYVGIYGGVPLTSINKISDSSGTIKTEFDPGYMGGLAAGAIFETNGGWNIERIRAEAEVGYRTNNVVRGKNLQGKNVDLNGKVSLKNYMVNGYLDNTSILSTGHPVLLFLTAGAGIATATIDSISYNNKNIISSSYATQFAYQGGIGIGYELTRNITVDAAYKYMATTAFEFGNIKAEYGCHSIQFGAQYIFR